MFERRAGQARAPNSNGISRADAILQELKMKPEFEKLLNMDYSSSSPVDVTVMNQGGCAACLPNHFTSLSEQHTCDEFSEQVRKTKIFIN